MVQTSAAQAATQATAETKTMNAKQIMLRLQWYLFILLAVVTLLQEILK